MTAPAPARRLRRRWPAVAGLVLLVAVLTAVPLAARPRPAAAGPAGNPPVVLASLGAGGVDEVSLGDPAAGPSTNAPFGRASAGAVAIDPTATTALVAGTVSAATFVPPPFVALLDVASGRTTATIQLTGGSPIAGLAMDPADPTVAFALRASGEIDQLAIGGAPAVSRVVLTAAAINPNGSYTFTSLASIPDGSHLLAGFGLDGADFGVTDVDVASGNLSNWLDRGGVTADVAVAPDGSRVYLAVVGPPGGVVALPYPLPKPFSYLWATGLSAGTSAHSLTVSPDGNRVYVGGALIPPSGAAGSAALTQLDAAGGSVQATVALPAIGAADNTGGVTGVALSPDGRTLMAAGRDSAGGHSYAVALAVPGLAPGPAGDLGATGAGGAPQDIAITPDQAPVASLAAAAGTAGAPVTLDASASTVAYGSITGYRWDFGDGATAATTGPQAVHTYAAAGNYTVTVTEVDSAGNSTAPAPFVSGPVNGPGTTPYLRASDTAKTAAPVAISPPGTTPPPVPTTAAGTGPHPTTSPTTAPRSRPGSPRPRPGAGRPVLHVEPVLGPPGAIVTVTGTGFGDHVPVTVSWSVSTGSVVIMSDGSGNLPPTALPVLVPDVLGPRFAVAAGTAARAAFLVVPESSEPGGPGGGMLFRTQGP